MSASEQLGSLLAGKNLLIFDFDGTVADTSALHAAAFEEVLAPLGVRLDYATIAGLKTRDAMTQCLAPAGIRPDAATLDKLVRDKQHLVRELISRRLEPIEGVDEFLQWAKKRFVLSMATSGSRGTVSLALEKLGYTGCFSPLVCAEDVERSKPSPDAFLRVLEITSTSSASALVFEDSDAGFAAARAAGLDCIDARTSPWHELMESPQYRMAGGKASV